MFTKSFTGKIISGVVVVGLLVVSAPLLSYLQTAFSFNNPGQNPPGGGGLLKPDSQNPNKLTISGDLDVLSNRIVGLVTPVSANEAANKAYVDAQVNNARGGSVVMYGVSQNTPQAGSIRRPAGWVPNCSRAIPGADQQSGCTSWTVAVQPGAGTPSCPVGWTELYAGYGPMNTLWVWYDNVVTDAYEDSTANAAAIGTNSICSTSWFENVQDVSFAPGAPVTQAVQNQSSILSACTVADVCNTCRVCIK